MRKLTAALAALVLVALTALPALASSHSTNHTGYWENLGYGQCEKSEPGGKSITLDDPPFQRYYTLLIVKGGASASNQGGVGYVAYTDPEPGVAYDAPVGNNGKVRDISHVIVCTYGVPSDDEPRPPTPPPPPPPEEEVDCLIEERSARGYCPGQPGHENEIPDHDPDPNPEPEPRDKSVSFTPAGVGSPPPPTLPVTGSEAPLLAALGLALVLAGTATLRYVRA